MRLRVLKSFRRITIAIFGILGVSMTLFLFSSIRNSEKQNGESLLHSRQYLGDNPRAKESDLPKELYPATIAVGTQFDLRQCNDTEKQFRGTFEQNLRKLQLLTFPEADIWIEKLGLDIPRSRDIPSFPVLVTGASDGFFDISQGLIQTVHRILLPKYPELKFIYYDLGLKAKDRRRLERYCKCEVRDFPSPDDLPPHVRSWRNFAFKPIIVSILFREFGNVWWVDNSVRFITDDLEKPLQYLREHGSLFFTYDNILSVAKHTVIKTFNYFKENPCPYSEFGEVEAGNVAFYDNSASRTIVRKWVACALMQNCIAPPGTYMGCSSRSTIAGGCHRYDQSVLSIILRRLYHKQNDYPLVQEPFRLIIVRRGHRVDYLPH